MASPFLLYTGILSVAVIVTLFLGTIGIARRAVAGSSAFIGMVFSGAFYAFGSIFEIRSLTAEEVWFWLSFEYIGIATLGAFWLILSRQTAGKLADRDRYLVPVAFVVPAIIIAGVWTNPIHNAFYSSIVITIREGFTVPVLGKGPLYWVNMAYMNLCILGGTVTTGRRFFSASGLFRKQAILMFIGSLVPWVGMLVYQLGLSPYGLDLAPIGVAISGCLFAWGLFSFRLFDLAPLYHENVFRDMSDGVLVSDAKGRMVGVNPAIATILPEAVPDRIGERTDAILHRHPGIMELLEASARESAGNEPVYGDVEIQQAAGVRNYAVTSSRLRDSKGRRLGTILSFSDITHRVELAARLEELASVDPLTGIYNRRRFFEEAEREMAKARRTGRSLALGVVDLDFFKTVNDRYGHQTGDAVLASAAQIFKAKLRETDLLGRYGGEEFVFLLPETSKDTAVTIAERLRASIEETSVACEGERADRTIRVTASFGLACCEGCGQCSLDNMVARGDAALYAAKSAGRNRVVLAGQPQQAESDSAPRRCSGEN